MSQSSNSNYLPSILAILAMLTATGGIWYLDQPFRSFRPSMAKIEETPSFAELSVQARLWEDPLNAVRQREYGSRSESSGTGKNSPSLLENKTHKSSDGLASLCKQLSDVQEAMSKEGKSRPIAVMPIFIPGNIYNSDHESRLRTRYAVLAALKKSKFEWDQWDRIGYFKVDQEWLEPSATPIRDKKGSTCGELATPNEEAPPAAPLLVPYEWFSPDSYSDQSPAKLLVLWIDDTKFYEQPLLRVIKLIHLISPLDSSDWEYSVRIIGPTWSSTLQSLLEDLNGLPDYQKNPALKVPEKWNLAVFSPWATSNLSYLWPQEKSERLCPKYNISESVSPSRIWLPRNSLSSNQREKSGSKGSDSPCAIKPAPQDLKIERTIAEDGQLIGLLALELKARGVDVCNGEAMLLISELDSSYGQLFEDTFSDQLEVNKGNLCDGKKPPTRWTSAAYFMGLDGILPGNTVSTGQPQTEGSQTTRAAPEDIERPSGQSQLDYLRRLADRLTRKAGKVQAVGVLGSDVFDKLLVLEALYDRLPNAIFFTTDLDAHFLHPSQRRWTRNLIVASSFDFYYPHLNKSRSEIDQDAANLGLSPFRDTYQTAMFDACLRACVFNQESQTIVDDWGDQKSPKLYEIGRTNLFDLKNMPSVYKPGWVKAIIVSGALIIVLFAYMFFFNTRRKGNRTSGFWSSWPCFMVLVLAVALIATVASCYFLQIHAEPFAWLQGISIWPSAFLRILAAILAAAALAWLPHQIEASNRELGKAFHLQTNDEGGSVLQWQPIACFNIHHSASTIPVASLWADYQDAGSLKGRYKRIAVACVLYIIFAGVIFYFFHMPHVPYRGNGSRLAANIPLFVVVALQIVLTFFVVDATCLCCRLVWQLARFKHEWPKGAASRWDCPEEMADEALVVDLIARRTKVIGKMILYPFAVLLLVIVSRNLYFARWDWPISLVIIQGTYSLIAFCCSFFLWLSGKRVRDWALGRLQDKLLLAESTGKHAHRLQLMAENVRSARVGAFAPLSEQPLFSALLLPFGGVGITSLLNYFANIW